MSKRTRPGVLLLSGARQSDAHSRTQHASQPSARMLIALLTSWSCAACAGSSDDADQGAQAAAPDTGTMIGPAGLDTAAPFAGPSPSASQLAPVTAGAPAVTPEVTSTAATPAPSNDAPAVSSTVTSPPVVNTDPTATVEQEPAAPSATQTSTAPATSGTAPAPEDGTEDGTEEMPGMKDHCLYGRDPEPSDLTMADGPAEFYPAGREGDKSIVDLTLQPEVLDWMYAHKWQEVHVEWHAIRTCSLGGRGSHIDICQFTQLIPTDQNCQSRGDGLQFLMFHRHMMESLRQMWPNHSEQFTGFETFPSSADDVPEQWRDAWKPFSDTAIANGKIGDEIDKPENLAKFEDEGQLGFWLQCMPGQVLEGFATSGIHGDLHGHWIRPGNTAHGVGNTNANIDNYMFYKLHGWIDNVWERYRTAKGLTREDPDYVAGMLAQCREMDTLEQIILNMSSPDDVDGPTSPADLPTEIGFFHEQVRPILENETNHCSGCHSESGPEAGMTLGGIISSTDIVAALVDQPSRGGGEHVLVKPGSPEESWLYLKASGRSLDAECTATATAMCKPGVMPPASSGETTMTDEQLAILAQWITDGAPAPEILSD